MGLAVTEINCVAHDTIESHDSFLRLIFFFEEIEAWMRENEGNEDLMREFEQEALGDGATSQEFDKFLRKRSEAALTPK